MSMQNYPDGGYVIELTNDNLKKIGENVEYKVLSIIESDYGRINDANNKDQIEYVISTAIGIPVQIIFIDENFEGLDEVEPGKWYILFSVEQLFNIVPNWIFHTLFNKKVEPKKASWSKLS